MFGSMVEEPLPEPPWLTPSRPPVGRVPLTRDAIVEAALHVLDRDGPHGLSMRAVARELGAGAASLYGHVANKEELIQLVMDRVFAELPVPRTDLPPARWQDQVKDFLRQARAAFTRHPGSAALTLGRIPVGPNSIVAMEAMLAIARAAGLPDQVAAFAGDLLGLYVGAFAYEESLGGDVDKQVDQFREWLLSLPPSRFPNFVALAPLMTAGGPDERFEWGLDVLVRGLASFGPAATPPPPG